MSKLLFFFKFEQIKIKMHLFTITFHAYTSLAIYTSSQYEKMSIGVFKKFSTLLEERCSDYKFNYEVYWRGGCIVTDIVVKLENNKLNKIFYENENEFKKSVNYSKLLKTIEDVQKEFPTNLKFSEILIMHSLDVYISTKPFPSKGTKIDELSILLD